MIYLYMKLGSVWALCPLEHPIAPDWKVDSLLRTINEKTGKPEPIHYESFQTLIGNDVLLSLPLSLSFRLALIN